MEARFYHKLHEGKVHCYLCPHDCKISAGNYGICKVRRNEGGTLITENYGLASALHLDPVEKKPLYHFYPGRSILSLGSTGCNMHCTCCQNWEISQTTPGSGRDERKIDPSEIAARAKSYHHNLGVAYTYNEPSVWFEYVMDTAIRIREEGLKNVVVTNGFIGKEPLAELLAVTDAFNVDLKAFTDDFYRRITGARLNPVLDTLKQIRKSGRHLEITCLVIPDLNDDRSHFRKMVRWIYEELGADTVLHISRYHPAYRLDIGATSPHILRNLYEIAAESLHYVYTGNILMADSGDTRCSHCHNTVIKRKGFGVENLLLTASGVCSYCGNRIAINESLPE